MQEITPKNPLAWLLILLVLGYAGVLILAPIYAITDGAIERGWQPIETTLNDPSVQHALQITLNLSLAATAINAVLGLITAWVLVRHEFAGKRWLNALVDIPFAFSPVILGYALIVLFGRGGWLEDYLPFAIVFAYPGILIAKAQVTMPFVAREVAPVLESLPREPEEAAYTLGASRWRVFWRIIMPAIWVGLAYGVILALARALGEFGAVAAVSGGIEGKTETATMYVFRALQDRNRVGAYTISLVLGSVSVGILILMSLVKWILKQQQERQSRVYHTD
jgi:sulfate transport system permease protein